MPLEKSDARMGFRGEPPADEVRDRGGQVEFAEKARGYGGVVGAPQVVLDLGQHLAISGESLATQE